MTQRAITSGPTEHDFAIASVIAHMRRNPLEPLSLNDQAEIAGFSPFHFARLFRALIGIPPGEFQTALRFEKSKELLLNTDASVTEICFEIGYESLGTFSSRFRQLVGVGPQEFRRFPHLLTPDIFREREQPLFKVGQQGRIIGKVVHEADGPMMAAYIGVFPHAIARGVPVAGVYVVGKDTFCIEGVPPGQYKIMSAALPVQAGPQAHLVPDNTLRVAMSRRMITITQRGELAECDLIYRKPALSDPPILISLPALAIRAEDADQRARELDLDPISAD